ncbi:hypothetical protein AcV5_004087 [Taiwanofungus camphoratus]|nr:hypothetical protein AcV5_004087 [Antrodia cinnamomea]
MTVFACYGHTLSYGYHCYSSDHEAFNPVRNSGTTSTLVGSNHLSLTLLDRFRSFEINGSTNTALGFTDIEGKTQSFNLKTLGSHQFKVLDSFLVSLRRISLERLRIRSYPNHATLTLLLRNASSVAELELMSPTAQVIYALFSDPDLHIPCPRLNILRLDGMHLSAVELLQQSAMMVEWSDQSIDGYSLDEE